MHVHLQIGSKASKNQAALVGEVFAVRRAELVRYASKVLRRRGLVLVDPDDAVQEASLMLLCNRRPVNDANHCFFLAVRLVARVVFQLANEWRRSAVRGAVRVGLPAGGGDAKRSVIEWARLKRGPGCGRGELLPPDAAVVSEVLAECKGDLDEAFRWVAGGYDEFRSIYPWRSKGYGRSDSVEPLQQRWQGGGWRRLVS